MSSPRLSLEQTITFLHSAQAFYALSDLQHSLSDSFGRLPSFEEWAIAASLSQAALQRQLQQGQFAQDRLFETHMGLIHKAALAFARPGIERDDLVQAGCIGLMRAIRKFTEGAGRTFATYAYWWIRDSVSQEAYRNDCLRIPDRFAKSSAEGTELRQATRYALEADCIQQLSINDLSALDYEGVHAAVQRLEPRLQFVLASRYGFHGSSLPYRAIAQQLGVSTESARRLHQQALRQLKRLYAATNVLSVSA